MWSLQYLPEDYGAQLKQVNASNFKTVKYRGLSAPQISVVEEK